MESGGRGGSEILLGGSGEVCSSLIFGESGVLAIEGVWVAGGGFGAGVEVKLPNKLPGLGVSVADFPKLKPAEAAGLVAGVVVLELWVPNSPELPGTEVNCDDFTGAGVDAGVVESALACSAALGPSSVVSMFASLDTGVSAIGALAALSRALPKFPPKNEPLGPSDSGSLSLVELSAVKVDPRLKGLEPNRLVGLSPALFAEPPNGEPVVIADPALGEPKVGFDPKMLPVEVDAAALKPPFDANAENPPEVGAAGVEVLAALDPNTELGLPNPDGWPKAEP